MRGEIIYRIYGVHEGRAKDFFFGAFRTRPEAEAQIAKLLAKEMHGQNWAARYHNKGFVVREVKVETDFEIPSRPMPRERYFVTATPKPNRPGTWDSTIVEVFRRNGTGAGADRICAFERNYGLFQTFEPFRQGNRDLALISRAYTQTAVLDLTTGEILAEEEDETGNGFCPVGFYVPDWWDLNDGSIIPGSESWDSDLEWPTGTFGFVWGCVWGDDTSWKVQYLDLSRVQQGVLSRDERFGYVELATLDYRSPALRPDPPQEATRPPFIDIARHNGVTRVTFAVEMDFDLDSGKPKSWRRLEPGPAD